MGQAERDALAESAGDGSVALFATASAPEGDVIFRRWETLGLEHYRRLGVRARALSVRNRADANLSTWADQLGECSLVFFSGGNPAYLERTLAGTQLWTAIRVRLAAGAWYGGCSAGAMVVGTPPARDLNARFSFGSGLALRPETFGVHWDSPFMRALRPVLTHRLEPDRRLIGIGERTAIRSVDGGWLVYGLGKVEDRSDGGRRSYRSGEIIGA